MHLKYQYLSLTIIEVDVFTKTMHLTEVLVTVLADICNIWQVFDFFKPAKDLVFRRDIMEYDDAVGIL